METKKTLLMGAAVSGLLFASGCTNSSSNNQMGGGKPVQCHGVNSCKGTGDCGGKNHGCAGQNGCKGQGWKKMSKADCKAKGGKIKKA